MWEAFRYLGRGSFAQTPAFLLGLARRYGPVSSFRLPRVRFFFIDDPDLIREVLVTKQQAFVKSRGAQSLRRLLGSGLLTSEDPLHRRQRRMMQPAFHRERVGQYGAAMVKLAAATAARWQTATTVDVTAEMNRLTLEIAATTLFGANLGDEAAGIRAALTEAMAGFPKALGPLGELRAALPLPSTRRFEAARRRLDAVIYRLIEARRASGVDRGDLLSMLVFTRDEDGGAAMDDTQVRDEAMTLFLAGHETTANALAWTWLLVGRTPRVAAALRVELERLGREPTVADLPQMPYTHAVFKEAMRLYPPAWILGRRAHKDVTIGDIPVKSGNVVLVSPWVTHRNPRFYADPERFIPERWEGAELPRFAYFPFGGGTRVCIGEPFAWMEGVLVLATLARRFALEPLVTTNGAIDPIVTLRPKYPLWMSVTRIADQLRTS